MSGRGTCPVPGGTRTSRPLSVRRRSIPRFFARGGEATRDPSFPGEPTSGIGIRIAGSAPRRSPTNLPSCRSSSLGVFFIRLLTRRVGPGDQRPGLSHPEAKLSEQSLTLAYPQIHPEAFPDKGRQGLPVPQVDSKPRLLLRLSPDFVDPPHR